ncbi:hypothetical protein DS98103_37 [Lactococcus phage 98103]|uniref:hypothetical protein n=1 Tax=Lactococcus lactis TaxID=1358 RepID=UPI00098068CC|nr:hypothetical protein [Lactococcus lactis]ANT43844.1 hypothetical protein DS98103_37 [Lactococcus phage 98103]ANT43900.1 hypothetical protein DS98104_35 [Lactococcus phage 98104]UXD81205.1 hypothetical protein D2544_006 [Lactococcus phage D2544]UXD81262.1 hypothetical protein D2950_006 [Lactococcus phage D2950]UXD81316.1 hypothetical protein D3906_006 [Lactococcus phage D3906]
MLKIKVEAVVKQRLFYRFSIIKIRFISFFNKQLASKMAEELIKDIESNFKKYFLCKVKSPKE